MSDAYVPTKYDSVFWIEVDKIKPNPFQPRREFDEDKLKALAESIRQYGMLQPLVVTRSDVEKPDGGLGSEYELISGERRLRASKLIGLLTVPAVIRHGENNLTKLELAIIENLQREDLNAIDRAKALNQLIKEFGLSHAQVAAKIGKSREYVSNSVRLLSLPDYMQQAIVGREMSEGHARALLALNDKVEERETLFKEIVLKKMSVRAAEQVARSIAQDRVRKYHRKSPEMSEIEKSLTETLGTRVIIEANEQGGRLMIDFFSPEDLSMLVASLAVREATNEPSRAESRDSFEINTTSVDAPIFPNTTQVESAKTPSAAEELKSDDDLYSIKNFSV
ncbi:MAG: ParB/RepB/Spo0J family partition protein [bacterium]|nr:ParB/RepB/Spo0J family partition protein [bacterium]